MEEYLQDDRFIMTHYGDDYNKYMGAVVPPVFMNSLHVFSSVEDYYAADRLQEEEFIYGRSGNPTVRLVEKKIAAMEHGKKALCFASGMAAASTAVMVVCKAGSHIICVRNAYGPLREFLVRYCASHLDIETTFVSGERIEDFEESIRPETKLIILESPSSIIFSLQDLRAVAGLAKRHGIRTYIDNTFCSPLFQKPLDMGIDLVMHTMSKYIGGHSDIIGGVLVSKDEELMREISADIREWFGGILGPMEGWLALRGIRTLQVRLKQHQENALAVAEFLEGHPKIKKVYYPGLKSHPQYELMRRQQSGNSGLLSFEVDAEPAKTAAKANGDIFKTFKIGVSWGGFESLLTMPFYKLPPEDAEKLGVSPGIVRIHCGLEGADHLIRDLAYFLDSIEY